MNDIPDERELAETAALWRRLREAEIAAGPCPGEGELAAFLDGGPSSERSGEIEEHLSLCPACARLIAEHVRSTSPGREGASLLGELLSVESLRRARDLIPARPRRLRARLLVAASWLGLFLSVAAAGAAGYSAGLRMLEPETPELGVVATPGPLDPDDFSPWPGASTVAEPLRGGIR